MEAKNVGKVILQGFPEVLCPFALDERVEEGEVAERLADFFVRIQELFDRVGPGCGSHESELNRPLVRISL